jgi:hypothetical protein
MKASLDLQKECERATFLIFRHLRMIWCAWIVMAISKAERKRSVNSREELMDPK